MQNEFESSNSAYYKTAKTPGTKGSSSVQQSKRVTKTPTMKREINCKARNLSQFSKKLP